MKCTYLNDIIEAVENCQNNCIDIPELLQDLDHLITQTAEKHNICLKCHRYMEIEKWKEPHPYQEGYVYEEWAKYICPTCGDESNS